MQSDIIAAPRNVEFGAPWGRPGRRLAHRVQATIPASGPSPTIDGVTMGTIIWVVVLLIVAYVLLRAVPDIARYIKMRRM